MVAAASASSWPTHPCQRLPAGQTLTVVLEPRQRRRTKAPRRHSATASRRHHPARQTSVRPRKRRRPASAGQPSLSSWSRVRGEGPKRHVRTQRPRRGAITPAHRTSDALTKSAAARFKPTNPRCRPGVGPEPKDLSLTTKAHNINSPSPHGGEGRAAGQERSCPVFQFFARTPAYSIGVSSRLPHSENEPSYTRTFSKPSSLRVSADCAARIPPCQRVTIFLSGVRPQAAYISRNSSALFQRFSASAVRLFVHSRCTAPGM